MHKILYFQKKKKKKKKDEIHFCMWNDIYDLKNRCVHDAYMKLFY